MYKFIFLVLAICGLSTAQIKSSGPCPAVQAKIDFDLNQYMGEWYEVQKFPTKFQIGSKCVKNEYSFLSDNSFSVVLTATSTITNQEHHLDATATVVEGGKLSINLPGLTSTNLPNFLVLQTDYDTYSVVYSCSENKDGSRNEYAWVLTRSKYPPPSLVEEAKNVLAKNHISPDFLVNTNQLRCPDEY